MRYVIDTSSIDVVNHHHKSMYAICSEGGCKKKLNHVYCRSSRQQTISQEVIQAARQNIHERHQNTKEENELIFVRMLQLYNSIFRFELNGVSY